LTDRVAGLRCRRTMRRRIRRQRCPSPARRSSKGSSSRALCAGRPRRRASKRPRQAGRIRLRNGRLPRRRRRWPVLRNLSQKPRPRIAVVKLPCTFYWGPGSRKLTIFKLPCSQQLRETWL
jgi:hypothetical protein